MLETKNLNVILATKNVSQKWLVRLCSPGISRSPIEIIDSLRRTWKGASMATWEALMSYKKCHKKWSCINYMVYKLFVCVVLYPLKQGHFKIHLTSQLFWSWAAKSYSTSNFYLQSSCCIGFSLIDCVPSSNFLNLSIVKFLNWFN